MCAIVLKTCDVIAKHLLPQYICMPNEQKLQEIVDEFENSFLREKRYHANLRYAENRSIPFSHQFAKVTRTHFTGTFLAKITILKVFSVSR